MVGGELSFQGGSYSRTPIEDILPVSFKETDIRFIDQEFHPKINDSCLSPKDFVLNPTFLAP